MTTKNPTRARAARHRDRELAAMLENRRGELLRDVQSKIRQVRSDGAFDRDVLDDGERSDVDSQSELDFALIQMRVETLDKVDLGLRRLEQGAYGNCIDCLKPIARVRLSALPFAVRCTTCEGARETADRRARSAAPGRGSSMLFLERVN